MFSLIRAVIDFCTYQKNALSQWKAIEVSLYKDLLQQVLSLLSFPRLEIADFALDALPLLYPNVMKADYRSIKYSFSSFYYSSLEV